jgi:glycosyltransferase involved in cell wall biosynthesis
MADDQPRTALNHSRDPTELDHLLTKLIIQIPCYNEESTLGITLESLPRALPGVDIVEWLVVDDGSQDCTVEVARQSGVDHVVRLPAHRGLARAFMAGLEGGIQAGADIIVNLDADNQYFAGDLPAMIAPILEGKADLVVGVRPISELGDYSPFKRFLHRIGTRAMRLASGAQIPDAPSGFRAMSREAAMRLNVFTSYTYTLETIIQAGRQGMAITCVPIRTNAPLRPSRLMRSVPAYVWKSLLTIVRLFVTYRPLRFFAALGLLSLTPGLLLGFRFLWFYFTAGGRGHIQSLILAGLLIGNGCLLLVISLVVDLIAVNRQFLERIDWRIKRLEELARGRPPDGR